MPQTLQICGFDKNFKIRLPLADNSRQNFGMAINPSCKRTIGVFDTQGNFLPFSGKPFIQQVQKLFATFAGQGRNRQYARRTSFGFFDPTSLLAIQKIDFIQQFNIAILMFYFVKPQTFKNRQYVFFLNVAVFVGNVTDMDNNVRFQDFFQRGSERHNQFMRQVRDKADRVRENNLRPEGKTILRNVLSKVANNKFSANTPAADKRLKTEDLPALV